MTIADRIRRLSPKFGVGSVSTASNETLAVKLFNSVEDCEVCPINPFCRGERLFTRESCSDVMLTYLERDTVSTYDSVDIDSMAKLLFDTITSNKSCFWRRW